MIILDLIYNLSLLVALSILSGFISKRVKRSFIKEIFQGFLFGSVAIVGMLYPFVFQEGIIFDGRSIVISLCSLFFGPLAGGISALMAALYRLWVGGGGIIMGISVITVSYLIGIVFYLRKKNTAGMSITNSLLYIFGLIVHLAMLILMLTLPGSSIINAIHKLALTIMLVYPFATLLIGKILLDQVNIDNILTELKERESLLRTTLYSIGDGVIATNHKSEVMILNAVAEELTGWNENEAKGKSLEDVFNIINEETRNVVENPVEKVIREQVVVGLANHTLLISKNGIEKPIADSGAPIRNKEGEIIGVVLVFRDQTEERGYQREISRSEKKYKSLFNSIRDAILITDSSRNIIGYNPAFINLFGYSEEEINGQTTMLVYNDPDEFKQMGNILAEHEGSEEFLQIINFKKKDGSVFQGETSIFNLEDDEENINGFILLIRDITARRLAEKALIESEERYSSIFKNNHAVMLILDPQNQRIVDANQAACDYYGYSREVLLAMVISEINILPKEKIFAEIEKAKLGNRGYFIFKHKLASGEIRDVEVYSGRLVLNQKELLYSIIHDITEKLKAEENLRASEDKMRLLVEGTPYLFFYTQDLEANITYVSPSVEKITGRGVDEWMGQKHWFITDNPINELAKKRTRSNLTGEITNEATWIEIKHKNGNLIMLEVYENPIFRDGKVVMLQGVAHDITAREKMMAELKTARDNAEASNKLKTEFLAQMSHEIRSPLNAVLSFTSLLEEEYPGKKNEEVNGIFLGIVSSGKRIIKTIDSILNMSELQLGIYELYLREINLEEILAGLFIEYRPNAELKKLKLIINADLENPVIKTDDYAVTQIIANLLDNALKYTKKGHVEVSLHSENENEIILEVTDTGIGISEEYLPYLFEEFSQEQQGYTRMFEGNGLGLALVKKYCELINAEVFVESTKGKGSIFRVIFKRDQVNTN